MDSSKSGLTTIDEYIAGFPEEIQLKLREMRRVIHETAPEATEKISYQMPTFYLNGNLVHFAAFKNHIGFYPAPTGLDAFKDEICENTRIPRARYSFRSTNPSRLIWFGASRSSGRKRT